MLGEKDLIYLAAALFLTKPGEGYYSNSDQESAVKAAEDLYKKVFNSNNSMIVE